jgi:hypothetical protein
MPLPRLVYTVTTRQGKSYWTRIGVAYTNRDGSINCKLDALPVNGILQIRDDDRAGPAPATEEGSNARDSHQ